MNDDSFSAMNNFVHFVRRQDYIRAAYWLGSMRISDANLPPALVPIFGATLSVIDHKALLRAAEQWALDSVSKDYASTLPQVRG